MLSITQIKELERRGSIGYDLIGDTYWMRDFSKGQLLSIMKEVALLFDDKTLLKHGHPDEIKSYFHVIKSLYDKDGTHHQLHIVQGKIPLDEVNKMVSITGYLPKEIRDNYAS